MVPRPYLSWSSYKLFKTSKEEWTKRYIYGKKPPETKYTIFGKEFAKLREGVGKPQNELAQSVLIFLPQYPKREEEMQATVKIGGKNVQLFGRFDGLDNKRHVIGDDKTGARWSQAQVDSCKQLTWYAYIYYLNKKVIPKLELNWIETEVDRRTGRVVLTGTTYTFKTKRTVKDFIYLQADINKVWTEMVKLCEDEWKKIF